MLRALLVALIGLVYAQYAITKSNDAPNDMEFDSKGEDKSTKSKFELKLRIRTSTDDNTLEFEAESRSEADKTKIEADTRFNVRSAYTYTDANQNGLLDSGESSVRYDLSGQWGPITCSSTTSPYVCDVCNTNASSATLPANALCFEFIVTENQIQSSGRTILPTSVKITMHWDPTGVSLGANDHVALIGRFRSQTSFKDRQSVKPADRSGSEDEDQQPSADGSTVTWEKRVVTHAGNWTDVTVGVFIPSADGPTDGTETDHTDGSSMSFRQLQFSFSAVEPFSWDPTIIVPTSGALAAVPSLVGMLAWFLAL